MIKEQADNEHPGVDIGPIWRAVLYAFLVLVILAGIYFYPQMQLPNQP